MVIHYDSHAMRACFAARPDVVEARLGTAPGRVLRVRFEGATAYVVFGRDESDARTQGRTVAAARANAFTISAAGSTGNLAFFVVGPLNGAIASEIRSCFAQSARSSSPLAA